MVVQNHHIEYLVAKSEQILDSQPVFRFKRYLFHHIDWNKRVIGIKGLPGNGKTTLMLHYLNSIRHSNAENKVIYINLDDLFFSSFRLKVLISGLYLQGYRVFAFDQVHLYSGWEDEFMSALEFFSDCQIVFSGSSLIEFPQISDAVFELLGLSYREFLQSKLGQDLAFHNLETIIENQEALIQTLPKGFSPYAYFEEYVRSGFFPSFPNIEEDRSSYLNHIIRQITEIDMANIAGFDVRNARNMQQLLFLILTAEGKKPNSSDWAETSGIHRNTLPSYYRLLEQSGLVHLIFSDTNPSPQQKPEKVIFSHPGFNEIVKLNFHPGFIKQHFALAMLMKKHSVTVDNTGLFTVDKYIQMELPVPGRRRRIQRDDFTFRVTDKPKKNEYGTLPLWMFGFLY
jgi:predicted AAA+ superfamily ATPase